jgi:Xaa-Pro dipeptidase
MAIEREEYIHRQKVFLQRVVEENLDGAVVVSRGGSTFDRFASVFYLTGHFQSYVYLADEEPRWSGRTLTVFVVNSKGKNILCVAVPEYNSEEIVVDEVMYTGRFAGCIINAIKKLGLGKSKLGLIGADLMPVKYWQSINAELDQIQWSYPDEIIAAMTRVKSPAELDLLRAAAATSRRAYTKFLQALEPGRTEAEAVAAAVETIVAEGSGLYYAATSSGPNTWAWSPSTLPGYSTRRLESGDLIRLDLLTVKEGYITDWGRTSVVGKPNADQERLLDTLHKSLDAVIDALGTGVPAKDVVAAGDAALAELGVKMEPQPGTKEIFATYPAIWGHNLGMTIERPWLINSEELSIEAGMCMAVERALTIEDVGTAAAEQNLIITPEGVEDLTAGPYGRWS